MEKNSLKSLRKNITPLTPGHNLTDQYNPALSNTKRAARSKTSSSASTLFINKTCLKLRYND